MNLGRLLLPALRWAPETGFAHEEPAIERALALGAGGFIIFGGTATAVRTLTDDLVRRAGRPLLIGADLERGAGQQFAGLTELPPPLALASLGDARVIRWAGAVTAFEARSVGVNWVFAPVADLDVLPTNPIVQTRAFGDDPGLVAGCVSEWIRGCQEAGALACAKHYPGHGRTSTDSHTELPVVADVGADIRATDLAPFRAAVHAGVAAVMTAHVAYPALDPSGSPATMSRPILDLLRTTIGFDGLVVTDALIMQGARTGGESEAAVAALRAGVDLLLYPVDPAAAATALERAQLDGALDAGRLAEAERRYAAALSTVARPAVVSAEAPYATVDALADAVLQRDLARGKRPVLSPPIELVIVDDDLGGPYAPGPSDEVARRLEQSGLVQGHGPAESRVVLAFNEPRGWKGRAGFSDESRARLERAAPGADLVVLFGHPRLASEIPGRAPVLVAWHRQRLMQRAVARWLEACCG